MRGLLDVGPFEVGAAAAVGVSSCAIMSCYTRDVLPAAFLAHTRDQIHLDKLCSIRTIEFVCCRDDKLTASAIDLMARAHSIYT